MSTETSFGLSDLKKDNTWFILKSCSCAQKACQEVFQAHYSFGKLGGYKLYHEQDFKINKVLSFLR